MSRVKYQNPFAMGNLSDLGVAWENNDVEYLKEWSKLAVEEYHVMHGIQINAFQALIDIAEESERRVMEVHNLLKDNSLSQTVKEEKI